MLSTAMQEAYFFGKGFNQKKADPLWIGLSLNKVIQPND